MKELYMASLLEKKYQEEIENNSILNSNKSCINCKKFTLKEFSNVDLYCTNCGYDFVFIKNYLQFK